MKKEKDFEEIADFFYQKASDRIRQKVENCNLRYIDILYPDPKQISRIINNNRQRNNPYLINDSALECYYKPEDEESHITCGLVPMLDFNSKEEVLWGTDDEIRTYLHDLFNLLWNEVCINRKRINSELYLCDFIPYAKYSTYWKILFESDTINDPRFSFVKNSEIIQVLETESSDFTRCSNDEYNNRILNFPALFFDIKEDTVIENIDSARNDALDYLYGKCEEDFLRTFKEFTEENDSFHMLNNTIKNDLIEKRFLPLMDKYKPDESSLGLRVKNLIFEDLSYCAALFCKRNIENPKYRKELINASSAYIIRLEHIQNSLV